MAKVQISSKRKVVKRPTAPAAKKPAAPKKVVKPQPAAKKSKDTLSGLSLKQMLKATPPYIRGNADEVVVKALKMATTKGGLPGIRAKTTTFGTKTHRVYDTTLVGKEKGVDVSKQKHVLASCSCDWFWAYCEYALTHWGSAVIRYSNGEPASTTNPSNQPMLCKHLVALAKVTLEEGL